MRLTRPNLIFKTIMTSQATTLSPPTGKSKYPSPICTPIPFIPLSKPPPSPPPNLPPRPPLLHPDSYTVTHHVVPAAYPRRWKECTGSLSRGSHPFRHRPVPLPVDESKVERRNRMVEETRTAIMTRFDATLWTEREVEKERPPGLWMAAERWVRKGTIGEGVTLLMAHATGFNKEASHSIKGGYSQMDKLINRRKTDVVPNSKTSTEQSNPNLILRLNRSSYYRKPNYTRYRRNMAPRRYSPRRFTRPKRRPDRTSTFMA